MEPNQNIQGAPIVQNEQFNNGPVMGSTVAQSEPSVAKAPKDKKNNGMLIGLILCIVIAICGIGFGIWAMMDGNSRVDGLNTQIKALQGQNVSLSDKVAELEEELSNITSGNKEWAETELVDGVFYIKNANGDVIAQSEGVDVEEIVSCEGSSDDTVLKCIVNTAEGEGWFLYDIYGDSLVSSFDNDDEIDVEIDDSEEVE